MNEMYKWFFQLDIYGATTNEKGVWVLNPGSLYIVNVFTNINESRRIRNFSSDIENQNSIYIIEDIVISIGIDEPNDNIYFDDLRYIVNPLNHHNKRYTFNLRVSNTVNKFYFYLNLRYNLPKSHFSQILTSVMIEVDGLEDNSSKMDLILKSSNINPEEKLPHKTAILYVNNPSEKKIYLQGWAGNNYFSQDIKDYTEKSIADLIIDEKDPKKIRNIFKYLSRNKFSELIIWLREFYNICQSEFSLIIYDKTGFEIPWELIRLDRKLYLGIIANITRWTLIRGVNGYDKLLSFQNFEFSGDIVAYIDDKEIEYSQEERSNLDIYKTDIYFGIPEFVDRISNTLDNIGLIYLACHGIFVHNHKYETSIGSFKNPSNNIVAVDLEEVEEHDTKYRIVFINACHSGRLILDADGPYGLPETALALLAHGYIGTMGPIGCLHAAQIAKKIFHASNSSNSIYIAEILRQIRGHALDTLNKSDTKENWLNFLYTSMYVYYGNPFVFLNISRKSLGNIV
ncbi:CHAT domain-containing protein [Herpetosiphon geysericola]|uniref:CHAT domain-containing protein n=1 Tax=Herpetosiphon geysericola TaxID=70996 RepID=A0A0N8GRV7_9CHLR|nr:CHAT domain-containing protein [Herpetosiphon geysericola]KPL87570.1 hypothetical protein SE18_10955 [Herpetosiphon geysericola]